MLPVIRQFPAAHATGAAEITTQKKPSGQVIKPTPPRQYEPATHVGHAAVALANE